jgi:polyhydroxyalkanoate synthase
MNLDFLLLNPARTVIDKYVSFVEKIDNEAFEGNFVSLVSLVEINTDLGQSGCFRENRFTIY